MTHQHTSLLIAGCGYVGTALAQLRPAQRVLGLRRNPAGLPADLSVGLQAGFEPIAADLSRPLNAELLQQVIPEDLSAVVYAVSAGGRTEANYRAAYVDGWRHLLTALEQALESGRLSRAPRLIFVSSTSVYAQDSGEWVNEDSPAEAPGLAQLLLQGEALAAQRGLACTVLRLGGIYGPGRARLVKSVAEGTARRSHEALFSNRIHRDDCAGALKFLLEADAVDDCYLGVDCEPTDMNDLLVKVSAQLKVNAPPFREADSNSSRDSKSRLRSNKRCSNERLLQAGYTFRYPSWREGLREYFEECSA